MRIAIAAQHPAAACAAYQGDLDRPRLLFGRTDQAPAFAAAAAETADWPKRLIEPAAFMFVNPYTVDFIPGDNMCFARKILKLTALLRAALGKRE